MSQEIVVPILFQIVGNTIQSVNAVTGEVLKLAQAEDMVREKIEAALQVRKESQQAAAATKTPAPAASGAPSPAPTVGPAQPAPQTTPTRPPPQNPVQIPAQYGSAQPALIPPTLVPPQPALPDPSPTLPPVMPRPLPLPAAAVDSAPRPASTPPASAPPPAKPPISILHGVEKRDALASVPTRPADTTEKRPFTEGERSNSDKSTDRAILSELQSLIREIRAMMPMLNRDRASTPGLAGPGTPRGEADAKKELTLREQAMAQIARNDQRNNLNAEIARIQRDRAEQAGPISRMGGLSGIAMGVGGAFAGLGMAAGGVAGNYNQTMSNPWTSIGERTHSFLSSAPLLGSVYGAGANIREFREGRGERSAQQQRESHIYETNQEKNLDSQTFLTSRLMKVYASQAESARAAAVVPQQLANVNQSTLAGERERREDLTMLPTRERAAAKKAEAAGIEGEIALIGGRLTQFQTRIKEIEGTTDKKGEKTLAFEAYKMESEKSDALGGRDTPEKIAAAKKLLRLRDEGAYMAEAISQLQSSRENLDIKRKAVGVERDAAASPSPAAPLGGSEYMRAQLPILQEREQRAIGQATALGMAGPEQRFMAQQSLQAIRNVGIENAPQELIGQASTLFGEEIRKMAENAGKKLQPEFQRSAPDEYRYSVDETRKTVDDTRSAIATAAARDGQLLADRVALEVASYFETIMDVFTKKMDLKFSNLDIQKMLENSSANK
jgi:hypothetical protein